MIDQEIRVGSWQMLQADARFIREQVFILEQHIPESEEWDLEDDRSLHFIVFDANQAIATARLLQNQSIGRVAVLKAYRGQGIGLALMKFIIDHAKKLKLPFLILSAQIHAIGFYEVLGFSLQGEEYLDCGIPHIEMYLNLDSSSNHNEEC